MYFFTLPRSMEPRNIHFGPQKVYIFLIGIQFYVGVAVSLLLVLKIPTKSVPNYIRHANDL